MMVDVAASEKLGVSPMSIFTICNVGVSTNEQHFDNVQYLHAGET